MGIILEQMTKHLRREWILACQMHSDLMKARLLQVADEHGISREKITKGA